MPGFGFVIIYIVFHSLYLTSEIKEHYLFLRKYKSRYTVFCIFCMIIKGIKGIRAIMVLEDDDEL